MERAAACLAFPSGYAPGPGSKAAAPQAREAPEANISRVCSDIACADNLANNYRGWSCCRLVNSKIVVMTPAENIFGRAKGTK